MCSCAVAPTGRNPPSWAIVKTRTATASRVTEPLSPVNLATPPGSPVAEIDISSSPSSSLPLREKEIIELDYEGVGFSKSSSALQHNTHSNLSSPPAVLGIATSANRKRIARSPSPSPRTFSIPRKSSADNSLTPKEVPIYITCNISVERLLAWDRDARRRSNSRVWTAGTFDSYECLICPSVTCLRERILFKHLRGKKYAQAAFILKPKTCKRSPFRHFATLNELRDHLRSREYLANTRNL